MTPFFLLNGGDMDIDISIVGIRRHGIGQYYTFEVGTSIGVNFSIDVPKLVYDELFSEKMNKILEELPRNYVYYEYNNTLPLRDFFDALQTTRCEYKLRRVKVLKENYDVGPCGACFYREVELECLVYDNPLPPEDPEEVEPQWVFGMTYYCENYTSMYDCICMLKEGFNLKDTRFLRSMLEHFHHRYVAYGNHRGLV